MRWTLKPIPLKDQLDQLAESLNVEPLVAHLLLLRGITTYDEAKKFFRPQLTDLHDPFLIKDMDKAVDRIRQAVEKEENILVYGDYDVDGTTAVALMASYLLEGYPNVYTYIPDRYAEGYGLSYQGIDFADENGFGLVIALDCGIKAVEKVAHAKKKGIDFIICDHHRPGGELPDAIAVLDPKRDDCTYPYDELCGCGIGFKLIQALHQRKGGKTIDLIPYLDLVATAIGADIVPITGENRVLAHYGLSVINREPRIGFKAIISQLKKKKLTITDVVFIIAPRINAAGRMEHGQRAVDLLMETDFEKATAMAKEIEHFNTDRQDRDRQITQEALSQIVENQEEERFTSVVFKENWHKGVIGIVASRLTESYYRPTLVFTKSGDRLAASARSVKGFDVYEALQACKEHIEQFGGHKYAAGLTLFEEQYQAFKAKFEAVVGNTIDPKLLEPEIRIDAEIELGQVTPKLLRIINQFAPFGPGNMKPVFMAKGLQDTGYAKGVGEKGQHLKMGLRHGKNTVIGGIGFNLGDKLSRIKNPQKFDLAFSIEENEWNNQKSLQLKLKDIR